MREWAQGDHKNSGKPQDIRANTKVFVEGPPQYVFLVFFNQELRVALLANFKSKLTAKHLHFGLYAKKAAKSRVQVVGSDVK